MTTDEFRLEFLTATERETSAEHFDAFAFGSDEKMANSLLRLVLGGKKTATSSALPCYEVTGTPLPQPGSLSIITDWAGTPFCVIETVAVTHLRFNEMTFDICRREGEDECLNTWQEGHRAFFSEDGKQTGYEFTEDMPIVFEDFKVVYTRN